MSLTITADEAAETPAATLGALKIEARSVQDCAEGLVRYCLSGRRHLATRPYFSTSVNGQVVSLLARDRRLAPMLAKADAINADGQPMVLLSRLLCRSPLPERVATTDLFPAVAERAAKEGLTFYLLGGREAVSRKAAEAIQAAYPGLKIVGRRHGYFDRFEEAAISAEIASLKPDFLWVALGAPREHQFCMRNLVRLKGVGVVKTAGGLFDFLSGEKARAPKWMQTAGFEWLFRVLVEPRRLFLRYALTNPHAMLVMLRDLR